MFAIIWKYPNIYGMYRIYITENISNEDGSDTIYLLINHVTINYMIRGSIYSSIYHSLTHVRHFIFHAKYSSKQGLLATRP